MLGGASGTSRATVRCPTREFVELVARHAPDGEGPAARRAGHQSGTFGDRPLRGSGQPHPGPGAAAPGGRRAGEQPHAVPRDCGSSGHASWSPPPPLKSRSRRVAAMLDGSESIPGIDVDTDLRWLILGQLSEEGHADAALIQATMAADPSDIGRRRGTACLAARPTATAKEEAWRARRQLERADARRPGRARPTGSSPSPRWRRSFVASTSDRSASAA